MPVVLSLTVIIVSSLLLVGSDESDAEPSNCGNGVYCEYMDYYAGHSEILRVYSAGGTSADAVPSLNDHRVHNVYIDSGIKYVDLSIFSKYGSLGNIYIGEDVETVTLTSPVRYSHLYVDSANTHIQGLNDNILSIDGTELWFIHNSYRYDTFEIPANVHKIHWTTLDLGRPDVLYYHLKGGLTGEFVLRFAYGDLVFSAADAANMYGKDISFTLEKGYNLPTAVGNKTNYNNVYMVWCSNWGVVHSVTGYISQSQISNAPEKYRCYSVDVDGNMTPISEATDLIDGEYTEKKWDFTTDGYDYIYLAYESDQMAHSMEIGIGLVIFGTVIGGLFMMINRRKV